MFAQILNTVRAAIFPAILCVSVCLGVCVWVWVCVLCVCLFPFTAKASPN